jgi:hypothetical protein
MASDRTPVKTSTQKMVARPVEGFLEYLLSRAAEDAEDMAYEVAAAQLDKILSANSVEQMWDADDMDSQGGRDLQDVEQRINSFTVHKSGRFTSGLPAGPDEYFWILVRSQKLANGEEFVWNTGAPLILGKLRWLESQDLLGTPDAECVIRGTETPNGVVLKLRPVPKRATQADASS